MSDKLSSRSSSPENRDTSIEKKDSNPVNPELKRNPEDVQKRKEYMETRQETTEKLDSARTQSIEKQIEDTSIEKTERQKLVAQRNPSQKMEKKDANTPEEVTGLFGGFLGGNFLEKLAEWRNTLAFGIGPSLKKIEEGGFFSKNGILKLVSWFIGKDRVFLAEALKAKQFRGVEKNQGFTMDTLMAVHKEKFPSVSPEVFFIKLAKKARTMTNENTIDFQMLTQAAESLDPSDFTPDQLVSKENEKEPEKMKESTDLLKMKYPAKVSGGSFNINPDKASIRGEEFTYTLTHEKLHDLRITRAVLLRDGSMQISVTSGDKFCSGVVKANRLSQIVSGYADHNEVIEVRNNNAVYRLALERSKTQSS